MVHHQSRRHSTGGGGSLSLLETLEGHRKIVSVGKEDRRVSLASGYSADPTECTERSISSSVCLCETGEVMVTTRMQTSKRMIYDPPVPPPPPFVLEETDLHDSSRKAKSFRRRSMFGSSTPMSRFNEELAASGTRPATQFGASGPHVSQRRRSCLVSGLPRENDIMSHPHQSDLSMENESHLTIDSSPGKLKSALRQGRFSGDSGSTDGTDEKSDTSTNYKNVSKNMVKAFLKKTNRSPATTIGESNSVVDCQGREELHDIEKTKKLRSQRRNSLFGSIPKDSQEVGGVACVSNPLTSPKKTHRPRRHSLFANVVSRGNKHDPPLHSNNPYELINNERTKRKLHPFTRSMLLDSEAKSVAVQLSRSNGTQCRSTDYFGNIGKGVDVWTIHRKMMSQNGNEKANILSSQFYHYGIGMSRGPDGQIYVCHLFQ